MLPPFKLCSGNITYMSMHSPAKIQLNPALFLQNTNHYCGLRQPEVFRCMDFKSGVLIWEGILGTEDHIFGKCPMSYSYELKND